MKFNQDHIFHVVPVKDTYEHTVSAMPLKGCLMVGNTMCYTIACRCKCEPRIEYQEKGTIIVVHNSFDGREGVEWANEILNDKE